MAAPEPRPVRTPPLWLLVLITSSGSLGIHSFVPALPQAAEEFGVRAGEMQTTISLFIVGLAVGQLVYGPLSDRVGRRPALFAGLTLYTLAGAAATFAFSVPFLTAARLFQALGGCAGLALGRAMVRDTASAHEAASKLALLNMVVSAAPAIAPVVGTVLTEWLGWRSVLATLAVIGGTTLALSIWLLEETSTRRSARSVGALGRDYGRLLISPSFLGFAIGGSCATTSIYGFLAASPFLYVEQLGRPVREMAVYYLLLVGGTSVGNLLANRFAMRVRLSRLLLGASAFGLFGALLLFGFVLAGRLNLPIAVLGPFLFTVGVGIVSPLALTKAVSVNPQMIGSAAGLYGFSQMAVGAACVALVGIGHNPALSASSVLTGATVIGLIALWAGLRWEPRHGAG